MRCGNCMEPEHLHRKRREAAPLCRDGRAVYRPATEAELEAGYRAEFPNGPEPIAVLHADNPADMAKARAALSPEALTRIFGPVGGGMAELKSILKGAA